MATQGWIKLHRKIQDCEFLWDSSEEPFDRRSAWIDLLLMANHRDKRMVFRGKAVTIKSGQRVTSINKLAERWHWGINRVRNYLNLLQNEDMIVRESDNTKTLITIVNYQIYQGFDEPEGTLIDGAANGVTDGVIDGVTNIAQMDSRMTNNNEKNDKEDNKDIVPQNYKEIVDYLNEKAGTNYKVTTKKTKDLIRIRLKEGFTVEDFKTVIDKKVKEWIKDPKMNAYLRPETLFGNKFEGYLNQQEVVPFKPATKFNNMEKSEYSSMGEDELARLAGVWGGG